MHWTNPQVGPKGQIPLAVVWMGLQALCVLCGDSSEQGLPHCSSAVPTVRGYSGPPQPSPQEASRPHWAHLSPGYTQQRQSRQDRNTATARKSE